VVQEDGLISVIFILCATKNNVRIAKILMELNEEFLNNFEASFTLIDYNCLSQFS
jgi:hypothetical protein